MTQLLTKKRKELKNVHCLIFEECHHDTGNDFYNKFMKQFYFKDYTCSQWQE